jgi:SAM-dependent methyltransferase
MSDFDDHVESYEGSVNRALRFAGQEHAFFLEEKARHLLELVARRLGDPRSLRALDVGCGVGLVDRLVLGSFLSLDGVDTSRASIERAARDNPAGRYQVTEGGRLPFADSAFEVTFAICVLHHIGVGERREFVQELARVTTPGGIVVVFEHNPLNPATRLVVSRCEFDEGVVLLSRGHVDDLLRGAGLGRLESQYILFFPWRGAVLRSAESLLRSVPFGAQYYVAASRPGPM